MNILALDLGTQCGWALGFRDGTVRHGSKSFHAKRNDGTGLRWSKFRAFLLETGRLADSLQAVYYEDVHRHVGVYAAHAYGGFLAHLQHFCEVNRIPLVPVGVGQIKKHWTGAGNAKKDAMIEAAAKHGFQVTDDNDADALAILSLARHMESNEYVAPVKKAKPRTKTGVKNGK